MLSLGILDFMENQIQKPRTIKHFIIYCNVVSSKDQPILQLFLDTLLSVAK